MYVFLHRNTYNTFKNINTYSSQFRNETLSFRPNLEKVGTYLNKILSLGERALERLMRIKLFIQSWLRIWTQVLCTLINRIKLNNIAFFLLSGHTEDIKLTNGELFPPHNITRLHKALIFKGILWLLPSMNT